MNYRCWILVVIGIVLPALAPFAATPNEPVDQRLQVIYRRLHFSQQYPPEAAQFIQSRLQDSENPIEVFAELAADERPAVRMLTCVLAGEYGEAGGAPILWKLLRDPVESVRLNAASGLTRLATFTSFPVVMDGLRDDDPEIRRFTAATLATLRDKTAEGALIEALQDEEEMVRMEATRALALCGSESSVPSVVTMLQDSSVLVRECAASTLGVFGTQAAVDALIGALKDPDWHVRAAAVRSLAGYARNPIFLAQITDPILHLLKNDDYALVRDRAADALATASDEKVIDALVHTVVTDERDVRAHATQSLLIGGSRMAVPKLLEHRKHPDPDVRERIIEIVGHLGSGDDVLAVVEATNDPEPAVRLSAVRALQQMRDRGAINSLIARLTDANSHVRAAVCRALGDIGDREVAPKIVPLLRDSTSYVRAAAAEALGKLGDRSSIAPLVQVLTGDSETPETAGVVIGTTHDVLAGFTELSEAQQKIRAMEALGVLRAPEAVDPIIKHGLGSPDPVLRAVAAYSLGQIGDRRAVEPLQNEVRPYYTVAPVDLGHVIASGTRVSDEERRKQEKEARVRASVAWALGQIGDPSARDTLLKAMNDQNSLVRDAAAEALARIAEKEEKAAPAAEERPRARAR